MSLYDPAHVHATRYATEATKVFLMQQYQNHFPHLFQNAKMDIRPATHEDYYVPPSLASKAIVVVRTSLDPVGCLRFGCFPFKAVTWDLCTEQDPAQWVPAGRNGYQLACQPSCQHHAIPTEWDGSRCVIANPYKTLVASIPKKLFEHASYRDVFHGGLDLVNGTLKLNKAYCEAYGLEFVEEDCQTAAGQSFVEWFLSATAIRGIKTAHLKPYPVPPIPPLPAYLNYPVPPKKRKKRAAVTTTAARVAATEQMQGFYTEIALELVQELGEHVTEWTVKRFLERKAPRLLVSGVDRLAAKLAIKHSMAQVLKQVGKSTLQSMSKAVTAISGIYAVYEIVMSVVDVIDPLDFRKVMKKQDVAKLNEVVDYRYFKDLPVRPELTPEYIWENELLEEDETEKFQFMVERIEEYLAALNPTAPEFEQSKLTYVWKEEKKQWDGKLFLSLSIVAICFVILFIEWLDVWLCCLLFIKIVYRL